MAVRKKIVTCSLEAICGACADTMAVGFNVVEYGQPRRPLAAMDVVRVMLGTRLSLRMKSRIVFMTARI